MWIKYEILSSKNVIYIFNSSLVKKIQTIATKISTMY